MKGTHQDREIRNLREENAKLRAEVSEYMTMCKTLRDRERKLPRVSDPGVTMMLAGHLKAATQERDKLRVEVDLLRSERDEARTEAEDAVLYLDQHTEHHPWSKVPLKWKRDALAGEDGEG